MSGRILRYFLKEQVMQLGRLPHQGVDALSGLFENDDQVVIDPGVVLNVAIGPALLLGAMDMKDQHTEVWVLNGTRALSNQSNRQPPLHQIYQLGVISTLLKAGSDVKRFAVVVEDVRRRHGLKRHLMAMLDAKGWPG